ncbi:MAG: thiamine phosphate synthase [Alphaproteobacteria bacterium]|nr:thiamine phosphate synthase [Alphaproteobacteria bacterium]
MTLLRPGVFHPRPARRNVKKLPPLIHLTDAARFPDPEPAVFALPRGSLVILRHYDAANRHLLARRLATLCRARGLRLLIAGDGRLAAAVGADGLHLPEWLARGQISVGYGWRRRRPDWLITAAAHSEAALHHAEAAGADAVLLAPLFPTKSHPGACPLGIVRFARLAHQAHLPVYGLGGIDALAARRLRDSGAVGIAAVSALGDAVPLIL